MNRYIVTLTLKVDATDEEAAAEVGREATRLVHSTIDRVVVAGCDRVA